MAISKYISQIQPIYLHQAQLSFEIDGKFLTQKECCSCEFYLRHCPRVKPLIHHKRHNSTNSQSEFSRVVSLPEYIPYVSISPSKIVRYNVRVGEDTRDYTQHWLNRGATILEDGTLDISTASKKLTNTQQHHGIVAKKGIAKIGKCIEWLCHLAIPKDALNKKTNSMYQWKVNFVTFTLPSKQYHSDKFIKENCLDHLLIDLHREYNVVNYLWRAESQSNGNIHFHIITDVFLPALEVRHIWNRILDKYDYIDNFEKKHGHRSPNSTDVHAIKKIKNMPSYLTKYCGKSSKGITILQTKFKSFTVPKKIIPFFHKKINKDTRFFRQCHGRLWGCNQYLSKLSKARFKLTQSMANELDEAKQYMSREPLNIDFADIFFIPIKDFTGFYLNEFKSKIDNFIKSILAEPPNLTINTT